MSTVSLSDEQWGEAHMHLEEIAELYLSIGAAGQLALALTFFPLRARYERGERTRELYDAMMEVE